MEEFLNSGHEIKFIKREENEMFKHYSGVAFMDGIVRIYPEDLIFSSLFSDAADLIYNFEFRQGDVLVQGYGKTGTTWTQEIVWTMLHNPDLNNLIANEQEIFTRSPILEMDVYGPMKYFLDEEKFKQSFQEVFSNTCFDSLSTWFEVNKLLPSPRVMKCHLPPTFFKANVFDIAKSIYLIRDPRDVCLSFYHMARNLKTLEFEGTLDEYATAFLNNEGLLGDMANHIRHWLPYKQHRNVHFIFYEDLKLRTMEELRKLNKFLGTNLSDSQLENVKNHTTFQKMKKQDWFLNRTSAGGCFVEGEDYGGFMRKGIVGDHKNAFSEEMELKFRNYIEDKFKGMNLPY